VRVSTDRTPGMRFRYSSVVVLLMMLFAPGSAFAQRTYVLGATIDAVGGLDNNAQFNLGGQSGESDPMYSLYPGMTLQSRTARSVLGLGYAFGWNRVQATLPNDSKSHSASANLSTELGPRSNLRIGESFSISDDLQSFYALRGVELVEETLVFFFQPVAVHQSVRTNKANMGLEHRLNERSSLSLSADHSLVWYGANSGFAGLSDQHVTSGGFTYSRQINERTNWSLGYSASYFNFAEYSTAWSNAVQIGLTSRVAKDTTLSLSVGPSHVKNLNASGGNMSYQASASLAKRIERNSFHLTVSQDSANASGLGSISKTRRVTAGFSRTFGRRVSAFVDASAFDSSGVLGNPYDTRGTTATGNLGFILARNLSLHGGVQFQRYTQAEPHNFSQKRVFFSVRYSHQDLWRSN
jgi:hypothetical protein